MLDMLAHLGWYWQRPSLLLQMRKHVDIAFQQPLLTASSLLSERKRWYKVSLVGITENQAASTLCWLADIMWGRRPHILRSTEQGVPSVSRNPYKMSTSTHMQHVITDHLSSRRWSWHVRLPGFNARRAGGSSTLPPSHLGCFRSPLPVLLSPPFCFCHFWLSGTFLHGTYGTDLHHYVVGVQQSTPVSLCVASRNWTNRVFCPPVAEIY